MRLLAMVARRFVWMPPTLFGLVLLVFAISHVVPSDPARVMAGENAPPEQVEALRHQYGLDLPLPWQFARYVRDVATGNMGTSLFTQRPVAEDLWARLPATLRARTVCHHARRRDRRAARRGGGAVAQLAARSRGAHRHHRRARHGGVLAGDPAAVAVLDVAGRDAGAGPHRRLGTRSDHRLLHARRTAARRLGNAGQALRSSRPAGRDAGVAGDGDDRALHPRRRAERDVVATSCSTRPRWAFRAGAWCGNTSCAAR